MTGLDGNALQGGELLLFTLIVAAVVAFAYYTFFLAPRKMQEKARQTALDELAQEASEVERRSRLTTAQRDLEDKQKEERLREQTERSVADQQAQNNTKLEWQYGNKVPKLICPHCQSKDSVRRTEKTRVTKTRVNSLPGRAVGLGTNTEKRVMQLHCDSCEMTWDVS